MSGLRRLLVLCSVWTGLVSGLMSCLVSGATAADNWKIINSVLNENTRAMAVTPVFSQRIIHGLPDGWVVGAEQSERETYSIDFLPAKQTPQTWREMITLRGFRLLANNPKATPKAFLAQVAAELRKTCGEKSITLSLGDTQVDAHDAHGAIMGCPGPPDGAPAAETKGLGEIAFYLAIRGSHDMYVLQRSIRAEPFRTADAPINGSNAYLFLRELQPIKLCDRTLPESACIERQSREPGKP